MKTFLSLTPLLVSAAFATAASVATAHAEQAPVSNAFAFDFTYDRAELANPASAEKLLARLERSVRRHCDADRSMPLAERALVRACVEETMSASMAKFGSSTLTQIYQSRAAG